MVAVAGLAALGRGVRSARLRRSPATLGRQAGRLGAADRRGRPSSARGACRSCHTGLAPPPARRRDAAPGLGSAVLFCRRPATLTVSFFIAVLGWFGEAAGTSG